jgi:uncharacterized membrane protein
VAKIAIAFGILLILLGIVGFAMSAPRAVTALIPAFFGLPIAICGAIALNPNARKHAMHIAAAFATIGFLGAASMVIKGIITLARGAALPRPLAFWMQTIMLVLLGIFVYLCIRSFIEARRARTAGLDAAGTNQP